MIKESVPMMSTFEIVITFVNIAAVIIAPIAAVKIGQSLQDKAQRRKDKMDIFKTLMIDRSSWSFSSVQAMNIIEVVFADDESVCAAWKDFYDKSCVENPNETEMVKMQIAKNKLLETMAASLGYKDKVTWETIQNPYIPKGMVDAMNQQQLIQNGQAELAKVAATLLQWVNANAVLQHPQQQEDKPDANT
jgi:hypothetical protein